MALWMCADCTALYAVGAPRCPQCGCRVRVDDGSEDDMAKNTVHGGPTNAAAQPGGEDVSAGTSSSTSLEKQTPTPEPSETPRPSRARAAGNRSKQGRKAESSTAASTATSGPATAADHD